LLEITGDKPAHITLRQFSNQRSPYSPEPVDEVPLRLLVKQSHHADHERPKNIRLTVPDVPGRADLAGINDWLSGKHRHLPVGRSLADSSISACLWSDDLEVNFIRRHVKKPARESFTIRLCELLATSLMEQSLNLARRKSSHSKRKPRLLAQPGLSCQSEALGGLLANGELFGSRDELLKRLLTGEEV